jgi:phospholipid-binding lipoprotein MlaA
MKNMFYCDYRRIKDLLVVFLIFTFNVSIQAGSHYNYNYDDKDVAYEEVYDPYEKFNRKIFALNSALDHFILRPIALGYKKTTNDYTKARVGSFIDNINEPLTMVNYGLQGNVNCSIKSLWRFLINMTFGVGGLFDIASKVNLTSPPQTFGNTLAYYGVRPGPYLVIPFFGGTNARDVTDGIFSNNALNPIKYAMHRDFKIILAGSKSIHDRTLLLPFTDFITRTSTDPYIAVRTAIYQNREYKIHEGDNLNSTEQDK